MKVSLIQIKKILFLIFLYIYYLLVKVLYLLLNIKLKLYNLVYLLSLNIKDDSFIFFSLSLKKYKV